MWMTACWFPQGAHWALLDSFKVSRVVCWRGQEGSNPGSDPSYSAHVTTTDHNALQMTTSKLKQILKKRETIVSLCCDAESIKTRWESLMLTWHKSARWWDLPGQIKGICGSAAPGMLVHPSGGLRMMQAPRLFSFWSVCKCMFDPVAMEALEYNYRGYLKKLYNLKIMTNSKYFDQLSASCILTSWKVNRRFRLEVNHWIDEHHKCCFVAFAFPFLCHCPFSFCLDGTCLNKAISGHLQFLWGVIRFLWWILDSWEHGPTPAIFEIQTDSANCVKFNRKLKVALFVCEHFLLSSGSVNLTRLLLFSPNNAPINDSILKKSSSFFLYFNFIMFHNHYLTLNCCFVLPEASLLLTLF